MQLLLDTHTLLWSLAEPDRLPLAARRLVANDGNEIHVSAVSIFEIASRNSTSRRRRPAISAERTATLAMEAGFIMLSLRAEHAIAVETIAPFHSDPFDRLLLAQAQVEGLQLLTHDESLAGYDSRTILF